MCLHWVFVGLAIGLAVLEFLNDGCACADLVFLVEEGKAEELDVFLARRLVFEGVVKVYGQFFKGLCSRADFHFIIRKRRIKENRKWLH